jgi:hypothetical protein
LAQARELEAKLAEEYRAVRLLRASIAGEASARGERARELGRQDRDRINADFNVDDPSTPPRASKKLIAAATLLRAMPAPSTSEARNLHREVLALIEQAAVQQAESSVSRIRQQGSARGDGETDPRVWLNDYRLACQLGGATTDEVIIRNLPLHLADSARTWLEHLPAS